MTRTTAQMRVWHTITTGAQSDTIVKMLLLPAKPRMFKVSTVNLPQQKQETGNDVNKLL